MYIKRGFVAFTRRMPDHDAKMLFSLSYVKSTSCDLWCLFVLLCHDCFTWNNSKRYKRYTEK